MINLNEEQQKAVDFFNGVCIVTSVPGSGKTATLTSRVIKLIKERGVDPSSILCLTFTNKAANEMRERVAKEAGQLAESVWISTFHSLCVATIRRYGEYVGLSKNFSIYNDKDQVDLITKIARMQQCSSDWITKNIRILQKKINDFREKMEDLYYAIDDETERIVAELYLNSLDKYNAVDFSGILYKMWNLLKKKPQAFENLNKKFQYILVDEMQDTNMIQYEIIRSIADPSSKRQGNLFIVGDFCQSLYKFRGACPENINKIRHDFDNVTDIVLPKNYRSTEPILQAAQNLIRNNYNARSVEIKSVRGPGNAVVFLKHENPEIESNRIAQSIQSIKSSNGYSYKDFAILYRINSLSKYPEMCLRKFNIPYKIVGGFSFMDRMEIKTSLAYLLVLSNPNDTVSFSRAISCPNRAIGDTTVGKIETYCEEHGCTILDACKDTDIKMTTKGRSNLDTFVKMMNKAKEMQSNGDGISKVASFIFTTSGYYDYVKKVSKSDLEFNKRIDNVNTLLVDLSEFESARPNSTVEEYLQSLQLNNIEKEENEEAVTLSTVHAAKGLEFGVVYLVGAEEGTFPHGMSIAEGGITDERMCMYVAISRAKDLLVINYNKNRQGFSVTSGSGYWKKCKPSRFIEEMKNSKLKDLCET